ncbi:NB-ARC domain-containing protein [Flavobacterium sp. UBA7682]|uniref:NB-ARC domain-containing protein n=1 Tax=Flavobacterium sp. UBA7682 TaxID=1946560 RepID=UPI0025C09545|nr:NB-ARC domain-containing protein [Flavobacterium sp. UBA7682]
MQFIPFDLLHQRLESAKNDSDIAYFYDLLLYGEFLTKTINLFLVASINDDKERSRYRQEYNLVRANSIGDFSKSIDEILTGPPAQLLSISIRDLELKELTYRAKAGDWQYDAQQQLYEVLQIFNIPTTTLASKSPLRNWFNLFAYLRNKTKGHGAIRIEPCSLACPLLEKSIGLIFNNFSAFNRPWVHLHRNLSGKYRLSFLANKTDDLDYLKLEKTHSLDDGIYCLLDHELRKINLLTSNSELTDVFVTNGNLKSEVFESISYITDQRLASCAKNFLNPITQLPPSHTEGISSLEVLGECFTNLPVSTEEYISRKDLEKEFLNTINETERFPIITLLGKGGIGKTTLALNVLKQVALTQRFNLIIWFSARDIDLLMDGPKQVQTKVLNQKDISNEYCNLVYPGIEIKDKLDFFSHQLTSNDIGTALYVFDNFETVTNPVEVFEWINTYIRNPNKVIITSRISRSFKADYPIEVNGMTEEECKSLINLVGSKLRISQILTNKYIDELISESDGHPYIIKILLGEVAKSGKIEKIQRIVAEQEKILTALFKRTFNTLSPAAKRVFLTLSSWNSIVPTIAVEAVLWRPENEKMDVQNAIEELRMSSFIDIINEDSETLINVPLAASVFGKGELEVYPEKLKILEDRELLMEFGASNQTSVSIGVSSKVERKFRAVANRISSLDEFKKELPVLEYIATKYPNSYSHIISIFEEYGDYESVKYYIRENLKQERTNKGKALLWQRLADVCDITQDWEGESHALSELALLPGIDFQLISDAANRINNHFYTHPEARVAEYKKILLDKVSEIMLRRIKEGSPTDYSRLAWLFLNNSNEDKAMEIVNAGLALDEENQYCLRIFDKLNKK